MSDSRPKIEITADLLEFMKELAGSSREIILMSLATADGFNLKTFAAKSLNIEVEKLAAMASSICALSDSSALQLTNSNLKTTTIETKEGNVLFMKTTYLDNPCVITVVAKADLSLAQARFVLKRFADKVEGIVV